jgi:hypothetical protein
MRAWFDALEDKSLPSLKSTPDGEVAAAFKRILLSLMGNQAGATKRWMDCRYQSTCGKACLVRVWQGKKGVGLRTSDLRPITFFAANSGAFSGPSI